MSSKRWKAREMVILGLTGSIGMGKTTAAKMFASFGTPVFDADRAVHGLIGEGGEAAGAVGAAFPAAVCGGVVDREALGALVFKGGDALSALEGILHPLVGRAEKNFLKRQSRAGRKLVVLEIPLLYETGAEKRCDGVVVVSAPPFVQEQRVLRRPAMTPARFNAILARQMADGEKRRRADFIVETGLGRRHALRRIGKIVRVTRRWTGTKWPPPGF